MIAYVLDAGLYVCEIHRLVLRMTGVAGHPEFLPDKYAQLVAQAVESVALLDAAAPEPQQVDAALTGVAQFGLGAAVAHAKHRFGYPIGPPYEQSLAVDIKHPGPVRGVGVRAYLPYAEAGAERVADLSVIGQCADS